MQKQITTFLSKNLRYCEVMVGGIKYEMCTVEENQENGFYFEECEIIYVPFHGFVYIFGQWGYVYENYTWYRFQMAHLVLLSN